MRIFGLAGRASLVLTLVVAGVAHAQATRTWVSGVGDDVNPCSRTAPCKTFAGAISKTAAGGEISVLDPGGYGAVTITKSITIDGTGQVSSILSAGSPTGITVNDSATGAPGTIEVTLRNIVINGANTGVDGIRFISGKRLSVEGVRIANLSGTGIKVTTTGTNVYVALRDTVVERTNLHGIEVSPGGAGNVIASITNTRVFRSLTASGIFFNGNVKALVVNSDFSGCSAVAGIGVAGAANVALERVSATGNTYGVLNSSGSPTTRLAHCMIAGNTIGTQNNGGMISVYQSNVIENASGTTTATPQ